MLLYVRVFIADMCCEVHPRCWVQWCLPHSQLYGALPFVWVALLVLTLLFVEGAEEEKMETDADGQQPEKVNSV